MPKSPLDLIFSKFPIQSLDEFLSKMKAFSENSKCSYRVAKAFQAAGALQGYNIFSNEVDLACG